MILETLVTTVSPQGVPHIAPMGVHVEGDGLIILPFKPSTTLDNLLATRQAVINRCDDVRIFAGCLTGRRDWPLVAADRVQAPRLADCLSHAEVQLARVEDDELRPKLYCRTVHEASHKPFQGYNRAQFAVLEAAILVSRLHMLPLAKIEGELHYLKTALEKTAGEREQEAWQWLMDAVNEFKRNQSAEEECP
ncbi:DUF447 domain-containing protein [Methylogaea oryzae]|uniref:Tetrahydromethanopterin synthesis protein n=1 Tax=Methylogaea oryzae TaxID=1295382 RepID=A0A8D4VK30_9GAMM|nr:DUF447 domain-containing protein [Methylogaea oryzae]BBL69533.1 hypothetical protein MoryE10_01390 [Methylogaea oryzae]